MSEPAPPPTPSGQSEIYDLRLFELFEQAPGFMAVVSGPDHVYQLANPGYLRLIGRRDIVGRSVAQAVPEAVDQGFVALLDQVTATGEAFTASGAPYTARPAPGEPAVERYVDFVMQPIRDATGRVSGVLMQGSEVTERVRVEQRQAALISLTDLFRGAVGVGDLSFAAGRILGETLLASRVGYGTIDAERDVLHVERDWTAPGVETLQGETPLRDYGSFIDSLKAGEFIAIGDVRLDPRTAPAAAALEARNARSFMNVPVLEADGLVAVLYVNSGRARDWTPGEIALIQEVAERTRTAVERARSEAALRESEAHLKLMVQELNHRVKNNLATVQAIAMQTFREELTRDEMKDAFAQRVQALAVAHDILTREQWEGLGIEEIARGVLDALEGQGGRITLCGPRVTLTPKAGLALAMAFHELGTNALKYGALSAPEGRVAVAWASAEDGAVTIEWQESDGPPVAPPTRKGFGTRLLERGLASELNGAVTLAYPPTGVTCTMTGRLTA